MAPRRKYGADRLQEAAQKGVEDHKDELTTEFGNALGADFELNCRQYF